MTQIEGPRLDELADWALLETLRRDATLFTNLQKVRIQRHAIDRIVLFSKTQKWSDLKDSDYTDLLERYVLSRKWQLGTAHCVWDIELGTTTYSPDRVLAAQGIAACLMDRKHIEAYRAKIRQQGS